MSTRECEVCGHWHNVNPCPTYRSISRDPGEEVQAFYARQLAQPLCGCEAVVTNATCSVCGRAVYLERATTCRDCWYNGAIQRAEERFAPLTDALGRELEMKAEVWQTGGMVMCLTLTFPGGYVMFSEFGEFETAGFGMYRLDADGQDMEDEGDYRESPDIPYDAAHATEIAAWAAPTIMAFVASRTGANEA